jgi:hypothetical protein
MEVARTHPPATPIMAPCPFTGWWRRHVPLQHPPYLQGLVLMVLYALAFVPAFTVFASSSLRYITYAVPLANIFIWVLLSPRQLRFDNRFMIAIGLYTALLVITAFLTNEDFDQLTWVNAMRPVFYLMMFVPFMLFNLTSLKMLVALFAGTMILQSITGTTTTAGTIDFEKSQGLLESGLAFPLGAILIFCLRYKRKWTTIIVLFLFLAAFKRVSMVAVALIMGMMIFNLIVARFTGIKESWLAIGTAALFMAMVVMLNLYYIEFFTLMADLMGIEKSITDLTMGRLSEFYILGMQAGDQSLMNILFGGGPGYATRNLIEVVITYPLQIHNSYLLYYYDFGVIGFGLFMAAMFAVYSRNALGMYLFAYNCFIMVTDNSYTQHYHQFACFVLIAVAEYLEREKAEKANPQKTDSADAP